VIRKSRAFFLSGLPRGVEKLLQDLSKERPRIKSTDGNGVCKVIMSWACHLSWHYFHFLATWRFFLITSPPFTYCLPFELSLLRTRGFLLESVAKLNVVHSTIWRKNDRESHGQRRVKAPYNHVTIDQKHVYVL
jgi:hypothetical protein